VAAPAVRYRPTEAVVDLDAVRHNVEALRAPGVAFMAVVKANGYGHGAVAVARAAVEAGAEWLGVALVEEGIALREGGLAAPILVLTEFPLGSERDALAAGLTPTVYTEDAVDRLAAAAPGGVAAHVKLDTGMHRVGLEPGRLESLLERCRAAGVRPAGLWTHLATAEDLADPFADVQLDRFDAAMARAAAAGYRPDVVHAANSGAAMARPRSRYGLVRVGLALYGLSPAPDLPGAGALRPALSWRSAVGLVKRVGPGEGVSYGLRFRTERETTIATVPVGYADGYARRLSGRAEVLIGGRRRPVAGTVTMDQILVDCGDDLVTAGDEVVLVGRQGDEEIGADEVARWAGTIGYEVVCGISERVPRRYLGAR
jgi:alanine racemase